MTYPGRVAYAPYPNREVQKALNQSMENAHENGYTFIGQSAESIAADVCLYDYSFERWDCCKLVPFIEKWQRRQRETD